MIIAWPVLSDQFTIYHICNFLMVCKKPFVTGDVFYVPVVCTVVQIVVFLNGQIVTVQSSCSIHLTFGRWDSGWY